MSPVSATVQPEVGLIWAEARAGVIGHNGSMPWHVPEDLAHFKRVTGHDAVIMGRKTWDSLPSRFRPLPGRRNLVITRQTDWQAQGAERVASLQEAVQLCQDQKHVWVIGGGQVYAQAMPLASRLMVTQIDAAFEGDTHAPAIDPQRWRPVHSSELISGTGHTLRFIEWQRLDSSSPTPAHA